MRQEDVHVVEEQVRLRSILRLAVAAIPDQLEDARIRYDYLTPAQARVAIMTTPGIPIVVLSYLAGLYSNQYERE